METHATRRVLIVAHKSIATPALVESLQQRIQAGPCTFTLLIPDSCDRVVTGWTLRNARRMLSRAVGAPIEGIVAEGDDAFAGVMQAMRTGDYDEIMISLLPEANSRWVLEDLPARAASLGIPIAVVQPEAAHA